MSRDQVRVLEGCCRESEGERKRNETPVSSRLV